MDVATTVMGGVGTIVLSLVGFIVRSFRGDIATLEKTVRELETHVAVLLDRDRRKRLEDYDNQESS